MIKKVELGLATMDMASVGDTWDAAWADDDLLYVSSDDTLGFKNQPGSNLQVHILQGRPGSFVGHTINLMNEYGPMTSKGPDGCMWKANGLSCVEGNLYMFVSRHGLDFSARQTAENSSLIMSTDKGANWHRPARENYENPMFCGTRFGSPFFVKYGQDGRGDVHQADKYVYALANNGFWENGDDMILGRVLKTQIARLVASDWRFFTGKDGMLDENWSSSIDAARPILSNPGKCSMTGAQYIEPLKRYMMVQWYYTNGTGHVASTDTTWIFYEAPTPWGPWQELDTKRFNPEAYYNPCIVPKFISEDGLNLTILTNGDFMTFPAWQRGYECLYRFTLIPCTLEVNSS